MERKKVQCRVTIMGNEQERERQREREREREGAGWRSKTLSSTCASGRAMSRMLGCPRGSPFSSREKVTW